MAAYKCKICGGDLNVQEGQTIVECMYCGTKQSIYDFQTTTSINSLTGEIEQKAISSTMLSALKMMKIKQWGQSVAFIDKILEEQCVPEAYFYKAIALLNGKKAFSTPLATIKEVISNLDIAKSLEDNVQFYLLEAYVKYDYYKRKFLHISPSWNEELDAAKKIGYEQNDILTIEQLLGYKLPDIFG